MMCIYVCHYHTKLYVWFILSFIQINSIFLALSLRVVCTHKKKKLQMTSDKAPKIEIAKYAAKHYHTNYIYTLFSVSH